MDRRELLQLGAAAITASALPTNVFAQGGWKNSLNAYSRTLHWCRTPDEVAQACHEIGNTTIDLTVRPYPGHVEPAKVKTDLAPFVNGLKRGGITVQMIGMDVVDVTTPYVEDMLDAASSLGIHHTWWRGIPFDAALSYPKQLDALRPKVDALEKLFAKYQFKACLHPGGDFTRILDLCRPHDPRYIAIQYDTGNFGEFNQANLANQIREGGPYIGGFVFKDSVIDHLTPEQVAAAAAARGRRGVPADLVPAGGAPAGGAAPAGRGGRGAAPGGGPGGGSPNGWSSRQVQVGTGILNLPLICQALKDINFSGPIENQPEWPELGGPATGLDKTVIPRADVIRLLKQDYVTVSTPLAAAGVI